MQFELIDERIQSIPRKRVGFYPTPLQRLDRLSEKYCVNLFLKREDLAGPGTISGSKMRLAEFIMGSAIEQGVETVLTTGAYLSNSAMQVAAAAIHSGIKPILFLWDATGEGLPDSYRGNLMMDKLMGVEVIYFPREPGRNRPLTSAEIIPELEKHQRKLEAAGHKVLLIPSGATHPLGFVAHTLTFKEMMQQSAAADSELDFIYHTTGSGGTLPGLIAAKLLSGADVKIRSIAINPYEPGGWMSHQIVLERTKHVFKALSIEPPADEIILDEMDIDQRFIGTGYAIPSPEGTAAISELARAEGVFVGPVYTGKGFAGLLSHLREGRIPAGSNIAFIHSGDSANIFEHSRVLGQPYEKVPVEAG
jgi:L-cysteate sulfo-lyase